MVDRIGQRLGNYRLTQSLGQGGFAEVYLGEHLFLGTTVAIKVLHTQVAQTDVAEFQQEARILAGLKHPSIVRVLDFGLDGQTPYLVMDYAPGGTLRTRHSKGTVLPVTTVVLQLETGMLLLSEYLYFRILCIDCKDGYKRLGTTRVVTLVCVPKIATSPLQKFGME